MEEVVVVVVPPPLSTGVDDAPSPLDKIVEGVAEPRSDEGEVTVVLASGEEMGGLLALGFKRSLIPPSSSSSSSESVFERNLERSNWG